MTDFVNINIVYGMPSPKLKFFLNIDCIWFYLYIINLNLLTVDYILFILF